MTDPSRKPPAVLVSEVGGEGRWKQFSATLEIAREYFGTEPDVHYDVSLRHVTPAGTLQGNENPAWISKGSGNWSFELGAAGDQVYPDKATRPIVVFIRTSGGIGTGSGSFLYSLLMPGDSGYDVMSGLLTTTFSGPEGRLRRVVQSANELKAVWPGSSLWKYWP